MLNVRRELSQVCISSVIPFLLQVITTFPSLYRAKREVPDHREETEEGLGVLVPAVQVFREEVQAAVPKGEPEVQEVPEEEQPEV